MAGPELGSLCRALLAMAALASMGCGRAIDCADPETVIAQEDGARLTCAPQ